MNPGPAISTRSIVLRVLEQGENFGRSDLGQGTRIQVEFVSANPTGPLLISHGRGAVLGDALASLFEASGHHVSREYYINDAGAQVDVLARSVHLRYREALGEDIGAFPEDGYPGDYLKEVGAALAKRHGMRKTVAKSSSMTSSGRTSCALLPSPR